MITLGTHMVGGRAVEVLEIEGGGLRARVTTLGAGLLALWAPDAAGRLADVALGHDTLAGYLDDPAYLGVAVGRTAGRIAGASVTVAGETFALEANDGPNTLHGGPHGLHAVLWAIADLGPDRVTLAAESPDGAGGFPGALRVQLTYSLADGALALDWLAETTAPTPVALTHHGYWNLDGHDAGLIDGHVVQSDATRYLALDGTLPTGATPNVDGTALDLGVPTPIAEVLARPPADEIGLDHDLLVPPLGRRQTHLRRVCRVWNGRHGGSSRSVDVWTTEPGVHLYDGTHLAVADAKGGRYGPRAGLAIETQPPPDATRLGGEIPSVVLPPGAPLRSRTEFRFHTDTL